MKNCGVLHPPRQEQRVENSHEKTRDKTRAFSDTGPSKGELWEHKDNTEHHRGKMRPSYRIYFASLISSNKSTQPNVVRVQ